MTGRKWNEGTRLRYLIKIERVWRGIATRPELAEQMAIIQTKIWERTLRYTRR
jgi:hypothetical protein